MVPHQLIIFPALLRVYEYYYERLKYTWAVAKAKNEWNRTMLLEHPIPFDRVGRSDLWLMIDIYKFKIS